MGLRANFEGECTSWNVPSNVQSYADRISEIAEAYKRIALKKWRAAKFAELGMQTSSENN